MAELTKPESLENPVVASQNCESPKVLKTLTNQKQIFLQYVFSFIIESSD